MAVCDARNCPPNTIFTTNTLEHICEVMPKTKPELEAVQGVPKSKAKQHGARVLQLLRQAEKHVEVYQAADVLCGYSLRAHRRRARCLGVLGASLVGDGSSGRSPQVGAAAFPTTSAATARSCASSVRPGDAAGAASTSLRRSCGRRSR